MKTPDQSEELLSKALDKFTKAWRLGADDFMPTLDLNGKAVVTFRAVMSVQEEGEDMDPEVRTDLSYKKVIERDGKKIVETFHLADRAAVDNPNAPRLPGTEATTNEETGAKLAPLPETEAGPVADFKARAAQKSKVGGKAKAKAKK